VPNPCLICGLEPDAAVAADDGRGERRWIDPAGQICAIKLGGWAPHELYAHEAEEVIQDAFLQIWGKAATFDTALGAPFYWALSITRNRAIDRLRARQRRVRLADELHEFVAADSAQFAPPFRSEFSQEDLAKVRAAVGSLPGDQRQAIEMAFFGGMTHAEIAEALREPLGTVKARIRRGMLKLRETLQAYL